LSPSISRAFHKITAAAIPAGIAAALLCQPSAAGAATAQSQVARLAAWTWAVTQTGHPYQWGGTGPGYDCSGLVMMAYLHAGIQLPRTTYGMLASPMLVRVTQPRMGDLAFYGAGHVELFRRWGYTFGAHEYGVPVGIVHYSQYWKPTAFYRVVVPSTG
jgi:cell wall-associated NlpC family hydrolase